MRSPLLSFFAFLCCLSALASEPKRIVSINLTSDEILFTLLAKKNQLHRLVAVSKLVDSPIFSTFFKEAKKIPARSGNNIESILELKPDLVVMAGFNSQSLCDKIKKAAVESYQVGDIRSFADIEKLALELGALVQASNEVKEIFAKYKKQIANLKAAPKKPSILFFDDSGIQIGSRTLLNEIIEKAGAINPIAQNGIEGWPKLSKEYMVQIDPDFILIGGDNRAEARDRIAKNPVFKNYRAFKENRIIIMPLAQLYSTSWQVFETVLAIHHQINASG